MKKFITLMAAVAMAITASAETASFGSASNSGIGKDNPIPCGAFTIPADYNPGGNSKANVYNGDKGMKLRANKGTDANELMLTVNEGLTITDLTMGMVVNDANSTFSLSGISIDGTAVSDFTSVSLPNTTDANGEAVINLSGIKATQNIVFTYDFEGYEGNNRQVFIAGTVTFKEGADASVFEWSPVSLNPMVIMDVTSISAASNVSFQVYEVDGVACTEVMPVWVDEGGTEIKAVKGTQDDWNPNQFFYEFNSADFKANGEYILLFPEGMLVNAAGEKSAKIETPYTFDIVDLAPAMFDDFKILSIDPDLSQPQAIWNDQKIVINTNHNDAIGLTELNITDLTDDSWEATSVFSSNYSSNRELGDSNPIEWEVANTYKFYEGHEYKAELIFYNGKNSYNDDGVPTKIVDRASFTFTGRVEGFKYSDIKLLEVTPDPETTSISEPEQAVFTFTFSGPVNVYKVVTPLGMNGIIDYLPSCFSSNEDKTVWTIDLSDNDYVNTVEAELTLQLYARDLDGYQLKGNVGLDSASCFEYNWACDLGGFPIVVVSPADGASIESLSEIVVKSESGSPMSWSWMGEVSVRNEYDEELGTLVYAQPDGEDASALEEFRFTKMMDSSLNLVSLSDLEDGFYSLYFAPGCFDMGDQYESKKSRSLTSSFWISGATVDPQETLQYIMSNPEVGSTVNTLEQIVLTYGEPVGCEDFEVNVYNADQTLVTTGIGRSDYSEPSMIVIDLNEAIAEAGRYMVVIPARNIFNGDFYESDGAEGLCNPEYRLFYTVDDAEGPGIDPAEQEVFNFTKVDPADGSTVDALSHISLWFPDVVMTINDIAYVYKAGATESDPITTASVDWTFEDDYLINVDLTAPISEDGDYVVVIPARTICDDAFFGSDGKSGICNPEIRLVYTVDSGSAVESVAVAAEGDVFDVNGRLVLRGASAADIKSLPKGIYIIGGKKIVK